MARKPGPRPTPTNLQLLRGADKSDKKRVNNVEPQPREANLVMPEWLPAEARSIWAETAPELAAMHLSFAADSEALATYCIFTLLKRRALELVEGSNVVLRGRDGNIVTNPAAREARSLGLVALAFAREFGLTPSSAAGAGPLRR